MGIHEVDKMKEINRKYANNKIEKAVESRLLSTFGSYSTSILKLTIALALFIMAAFFISGAGVTVENGALNVSNNLIVNTSTLFVDSTNNRVGIGTIAPSYTLHVLKQSGSGVGGIRLETLGTVYADRQGVD